MATICPIQSDIKIQPFPLYTCSLITKEEFPIIGFYLYHVTSAGQSSNWPTSGIKQHLGGVRALTIESIVALPSVSVPPQ